MIRIKLYDVFFTDVQAGPPAFKINLRNQQPLPVLVNGSFNDPNDPTHRVIMTLPMPRGLYTEQRNTLAFPRICPLPLLFRNGKPVRLILPARVPLDEKKLKWLH